MCGFELVFTILDIPIDIIIRMLSFENIKYLKNTYVFPSDSFYTFKHSLKLRQ